MGCDAEYVDDVHEELLCAVCHLPMLRAAVVTPCGHAFCEGCLVNPHTGVPLQECPTCRGAIGSTAPSYAVRNLIGGLTVYCVHSHHGCEERMPRDALDHHAATCGFAEVTCPHAGCGATVLRRDLKTHAAKCEWAAVPCPNGCAQTPPRRGLAAHLAEECTKREVSCGKCGTKRKAEASEEHRKRHCPRREVECEVAGCGVLFEMGARAEHMEEHAARHVELLAKAMEVLRSTVERTGKEGTQLRAEVAIKAGEAAQANAAAAKLQGEVEGLRGRVRGLEAENLRLIGDVAAGQGDCRAMKLEARKMKEDVAGLQALAAKLARAAEDHEAWASQGGGATWVIDDFSVKRAAGSKLVSPEMVLRHPSLARRYAYKLLLYPHGDKKDGAVSLFFAPRPGRHPHRLEWPIPCKVQLWIAPQHGGPRQTLSLAPALLADYAPPKEDNLRGPGWHAFLEPAQVDAFVTSTGCMEVGACLVDP